jgi:hypothetical protein
MGELTVSSKSKLRRFLLFGTSTILAALTAYFVLGAKFSLRHLLFMVVAVVVYRILLDPVESMLNSLLSRRRKIKPDNP